MINIQLKITTKTERPLLLRTEIKGEIAYETATPSRLALKKEISTALKATPEHVIIKSITPVFGVRKSMITAHVYKNAEDIKKFESPVIVKRNTKAPKKAEGKEE